MNTSASYALEKVLIRVYVYRGKQVSGTRNFKENEKVHESIIQKMAPKQQMGIPFHFQVESAENYFLEIQMTYTSQYFKEQLELYIEKSP